MFAILIGSFVAFFGALIAVGAFFGFGAAGVFMALVSIVLVALAVSTMKRQAGGKDDK